MVHLPRTLTEVTPEWLTDALRESGSLDGGRVRSVQSVPLGDANGLMSRVARLTLLYDGPAPGAPPTLILKLPPENSGLHGLGMKLGFFEREARFYQDLRDRTAIRTPRCYLSRYDSGGGAFATLLEDLSAARVGGSGEGCSVDDGIAAMVALAGLHASWWNDPELAGLSWLPTRQGWLGATLGIVDDAWLPFVERFGNDLGPERLDVLDRARRFLPAFLDTIGRGPSTLLHGDFKLDNMFFAETGEVAAFDWGLAMSGSGAYDVAFFISLDFDPPERRLYEQTLMDVYLDGLARGGVRNYGYEEFLPDYRIQLVSMLPQLINAGGLAIFADHTATHRYATGLGRVLSAVDDHQALEYFR